MTSCFGETKIIEIVHKFNAYFSQRIMSHIGAIYLFILTEIYHMHSRNCNCATGCGPWQIYSTLPFHCRVFYHGSITACLHQTGKTIRGIIRLIFFIPATQLRHLSRGEKAMILQSKFIRRDENVITRQRGPAMPSHNGRFVIVKFVITGFLAAPGFMPVDEAFIPTWRRFIDFKSILNCPA